jgi:hypothetical protein
MNRTLLPRFPAARRNALHLVLAVQDGDGGDSRDHKRPSAAFFFAALRRIAPRGSAGSMTVPGSECQHRHGLRVPRSGAVPSAGAVLTYEGRLHAWLSTGSKLKMTR